MRRDLAARVLRVRGVDMFEVDIDLGFGVHVKKLARMAQRVQPIVGAGRGQAANHCLVILVGGKDVYLRGAEEESGIVVADVLVTSNSSVLPMADFPGNFIDVYAAMEWASQRDFDPVVLRGAL